jgi:ADP-ribose diphosphatase
MPKKLSEKNIFDSHIFSIQEVELDFDGTVVKHQYLAESESVMVIPVDKDGGIYLVREYFTAIDKYMLTFPKGYKPLSEEASYTANKELQEEIGFKAKKMTKLAELNIFPSYNKHITHLFVAEDLVESKLEGDEPEVLEVVKLSFSQLEKLILEGAISQARDIAAFHLFAQKFV